MANVVQPVRIDLTAKDAATPTLLNMGKAAAQTAKSTDLLEKSLARLERLVLGVFSVRAVRAVARYAEHVLDAADRTSELGKLNTQLEDTWDRLRGVADAAFAGLLENVLPFLIRGLQAVSDALDSIAKRFGLVREEASAVELRNLENLQDRISRGQRAGFSSREQELLRSGGIGFTGGQVPDVGIPGLTRDSLTIDEQVAALDVLAGRIDQVRQKLAAEKAEFSSTNRGGPGDVFNVPKGFQFIPEPETQGPPADFSQIRQNLEDMAPLTERLAQGWETLTGRVLDFGAAAEGAVLSVGVAIKDELAQAFADVFTNTKSAKDAFSDMGKAILKTLVQIGAELLAVYVLEQLTGIRFSGAAGTRVGSLAGGGGGGGASGQSTGGGGRLLSLAGSGGAGGPKSLSGGIGRFGGGGSTINHYYIDAVDAGSVRRLFLEHSETIQGINEYALTHKRVARENVRRAARR